jgi:hypothetical protein
VVVGEDDATRIQGLQAVDPFGRGRQRSVVGRLRCSPGESGPAVGGVVALAGDNDGAVVGAHVEGLVSGRVPGVGTTSTPGRISASPSSSS